MGRKKISYCFDHLAYFGKCLFRVSKKRERSGRFPGYNCMDIENIVVACVQKKQQSEIDARG